NPPRIAAPAGGSFRSLRQIAADCSGLRQPRNACESPSRLFWQLFSAVPRILPAHPVPLHLQFHIVSQRLCAGTKHSRRHRRGSTAQIRPISVTVTQHLCGIFAVLPRKE
ncbi:MAG: hypothetical protein IKE30_01665, partial [Clostridia bacterium]|nr:hypothetical protein [Clostridia bacterium]